MKLQQAISYSLMTVGALVSAKAILKRRQWEENNILAAIVLDWDDVQAVATRATTLSAGEGDLAMLLRRYKESGATHLSIPELTLSRLLEKGELSVTQGADPTKVYLRAEDAQLAGLVTTELQARLPHLDAKRTKAKNPLISFRGDLPTVAEVGLGFNPMHAELVQRVGLRLVPRPVGYSWVQPEMIERTLNQAAALGGKIIAVQGHLVPGFEFNISHTVEAMRRNRLTFAYFNLSRHQRGDWFLAKNLAEDGLVVLAHEFTASELLEEDWHTISARWANFAIEAGIRYCSVRFFREIHAGDPLESVAYVQTLAEALKKVHLVTGPVGAMDLTPFQPQRDTVALVGSGLSTAGAAGLASSLFPFSDMVKTFGTGAIALLLAGLPLWEKRQMTLAHQHHHDHEHDHGHHHHHGPDRMQATAYAPKGLALAAAVAFPSAAATSNGANPVAALAQALTVSATGAVALGATTVEGDYLLGVEEYRGYNLDWLLPLGLAASTIFNRWWRWLPLLGGVLAAQSFTGGLSQDLLGSFDREHRHAHTHHLSAFQRALGDSKMTLSLRPLRKWSFLASLGTLTAALLTRKGQDDKAAVALMAATAGQAATLTGFRNSQRSFFKTLEGRARGWMFGVIFGGIAWLAIWLWHRFVVKSN